MKKGIFAAAAAFAVISATSILALADDAKKEGDKSAPVYSVQCDSPCSFTVSGHDKQEVIAVVIEHVVPPTVAPATMCNRCRGVGRLPSGLTRRSSSASIRALRHACCCPSAC